MSKEIRQSPLEKLAKSSSPTCESSLTTCIDWVRDAEPAWQAIPDGTMACIVGSYTAAQLVDVVQHYFNTVVYKPSEYPHTAPTVRHVRVDKDGITIFVRD